MSDPHVSVIIPVYNGEQWVRQAIDSALSQSVTPSEIIVIDDGSTDRTPECLAEYGDRVRCIRQVNTGVAGARNRGLKEASGKSGGELIAFLDADDVWHPRKLEMQIRFLADHPAIGLVGTRVFDWPAPEMPDVGIDSANVFMEITREQLGVRNYIATSSVLVRRTVIDRIGEFDTGLHGPEDYDFWLRAAEVTKIGLMRCALTGYRQVSGSLSSRAGSMEAGVRRILRKLDGRDFWRGNRMLRRRAYGYSSYSIAQLHGAAGDHAAAARRVLESLAWYPLPMTQAEVRVPFGRARRLAVVLMRMARLKSPDPTC